MNLTLGRERALYTASEVKETTDEDSELLKKDPLACDVYSCVLCFCHALYTHVKVYFVRKNVLKICFAITSATQASIMMLSKTPTLRQFAIEMRVVSLSFDNISHCSARDSCGVCKVKSYFFNDKSTCEL